MTSPGSPAGTRTSRIAAVAFDPGRAEWVDVITCNLCGSRRFVVVAHLDRYGYSIQTHACLRCGLVFLNPVMSGGAYQEFYSRVYRPLVSAYHGRAIDAKTVQAEQRSYAVDRANFVAPFMQGRNGGTLLDVGGSTGVVASEFVRRFGFRGVVLDPSPEELAEASAAGLDTIAGLMEDFQPRGEPFDLVLLCQTVDHLLDVGGTLRKIHDILRDGGLFYLDIVDFRAGYLKGQSIEGAVKIDHPYYLTEFTIEAYLLRAGFEVLRKAYAADHLHVGYLCRATDQRSDALPLTEDVARQWREIRFIQNRPGVGP